MYVCTAEKGVGQRERGGVTVPLRAHDPLGPHIHHLASALRVRTPHFVETPAADIVTIDTDNAHTHTPLSFALVFLHHVLWKTTRGEEATTETW